MGYDVHILRTNASDPSERIPISLDEWLAYLKTDPGFRLLGVAESTSPKGQVIRYENPGLALWLGGSKNPMGKWFDHRNDWIVVKNPDREDLEKMRQVAQALGAQVQGDDGEFY